MELSPKKVKIIIYVLAILLVFSFSYILFITYQNAKVSLLQQGAQFGYQQAVLEVLQQAEVCQPIPIWVGNKTKELIAVDCLSRQQPAFDTPVTQPN